MSRLTSRTVAVSRLRDVERDACWAVFDRYYENVDRAKFDADLNDKQHVILLLTGERIVGFSTVTVDEVDGVISIFSGDTVLEADHHGVGALQWAFFRYIVTTKLRYPHKLVTWFLISKGYKTYLLLSRNFPTHFPRRDVETPPWARNLLTTLARRRFGDALDEDALILRFAGEHDRLKDGVAPVNGESDPDIRFFVTANPRHAEGDELCCLGVIDARLLLSFPLKKLRGRRRTAR